jgi:hypothetical protein
MDNNQFAQLSAQLSTLGQLMAYPATPDLAAHFVAAPSRAARPRQFAWALTALLVSLVSLLAVPDVRARVLEFLQIGSVRVSLEPDVVMPGATEKSANALVSTRFKPGPYGTVIALPLVRGEVTLQEARNVLDLPIHLPSYPADLGEPDHVYVQHVGDEEFAILVWLGEEERPQIALYILGPNTRLTKGLPEAISMLTINENLAALVTGNHVLQFAGSQQSGILVQAPTLIWQANGVTYRLEADLPIDEIVRLAESIK